MTLESAIAYTLALTVYSLSPGPALAATLGLAARSGFASAMWLLTGMIVGDALYLVAAVSGLAALAQTLEHALLFLRLASGAFLVYIGWQTWRSAARPLVPAGPTGEVAPPPASPSSRPGRLFVLGLAITLGNPKTILFYLGLLPSFVDIERMSLSDTLVAIAILIAVSYATFGPAAYLAIRANRSLSVSGFAILLRRIAALALVVAGLSIVAQSITIQ